MHAVVVRESGEPMMISDSSEHVEANVVPRVREAPGIVSAYWMEDGEGHTLNVLVFESEETAASALGRIRTAPRPDSMRLESADLFRVLASL
jgi:hypothetical protein